MIEVVICASNIGDLRKRLAEVLSEIPPQKEYPSGGLGLSTTTEVDTETHQGFMMTPADIEAIRKQYAPLTTVHPGENVLEKIAAAMNPVAEKMAEHLNNPNPIVNFKIPEEINRPQTPTSNIPQDKDSRGMPWDARVHSSSKNFTVNGQWRAKRNVDPNYLTEVENELMGRKTAAPVVVPPVPLAPVAPAVPIAEPVVAAPLVAASNLPPVLQKNVEEINIPPKNKYAHTLESFKAAFYTLIPALINEGKLTQPYIQDLNNYFKVDQIWEVVRNEVQIVELYNSFCQHGLIVKVEV